MKIVLIIPTYNEDQNIGLLLDQLDVEFKKNNKHEFHVLVVDGNSTDSTQDVVRSKMERNPNIHLLCEEEKSGLGGAYIKGYKYAINRLDADVCVEMDADFQHDPKDLLSLIKEIDKGYDFVIGSRFVKGGSIPKEWNLLRKFLSVGGSLFSKIVLGIFNVNDFTTGYRATRVKGVLDRIDFGRILSKGFAYKIDLLYRKVKLGAKVKEVPIKFGLRDRGNSKMERNNFIDSLRVVLFIRFRESRSFIKFAVVGLIGFITDSGLANIFRLTILSSVYSSFLSGFLAMVVTYVLNDFWSFGDRKILGVGDRLRSLLVYFPSSYVPIVFRSWLIGFAVGQFGDSFIVFNTAFLVGIAVGLIWNYTVYSRIIWKVNK